MKRIVLLIVSLFFVVGMPFVGVAADTNINLLHLSRNSGVMVASKSGNSKGSGFFIGDQYVVTCFHVATKLSVEASTVRWNLYPDLEVTLLSGETIGATVLSVPTQTDPSPLTRDFAILRLKNQAPKSHAKVELASDKETPKVGDDVVFSGYPLATPGMVTHGGMVSGFDASASLIFVQASINKGNSGGALLNNQGHVIGIVSMREGGISKALDDLKVYIDQSSSHGRVQIMGVDSLQATKAIIQTLDQYISTGIGYARSIKFVRDYIGINQALLR